LGRIVDLTQGIGPETKVFPGYPQPIVRPWTYLDKHGYYSNWLLLVEHTGTHMDSPAHFIEGAPTIDRLPPEKFLARAAVVAFKKKPGEPVSRSEFEDAVRSLPERPGKGWYILVAFGWDRVGDLETWVKYPYLEDDVADYIAELGVEGIGLDTPSPDNAPFNVHKKLLPKSIVIIENLAGIQDLAGKTFKFIAAPIKIHGGSAAPLRALAVLEEQG